MTMHIAMLLFPQVTLLDLVGPLEVFHRIPDAKVHLVWKDAQPVPADSGFAMLPTATFADVPPADVLFVPGGAGQIPLMEDAEAIDFLQRQAARAAYVTSVCTGSLLLGAAGLLRGYRAATHWAFMDLLPAVGAIPVDERVVVDRNRVTAGGVTAGIDFGLRIAAELVNESFAKRVQLALEYDPAPPFASGHPRSAAPDDVAAVRSAWSQNHARRAKFLAG
jgi:cyclohexyl-isocyanide hydratase